jgi:PAS domain S-box-containing protein
MIKEQSILMRKIFSKSQELVFIFSDRKGLVFVNKTALRILNQPRRNFLGKSIEEIIQKTINPSDSNNIHRGYLIGENKKHIKWTEIQSDEFVNHSEKSLIIFAQEILDVESIEQENQILLKAFKQSTEAKYVTDIEGIVKYVNPAFENLTGWKKGELIDKPSAKFLQKNGDEAFFSKLWQVIFSGNSFRCNTLNYTKNGNKYFVEKVVSPIYDRKGRITHFLTSERDISARLKSEKQIIQSEKIDTISQMVIGLAQEINNPMGYISGNLHLIKLGLDVLLNKHFSKNKKEMSQEKINEIYSMITDCNSGVNRVIDVFKMLKVFVKNSDEAITSISLYEELIALLDILVEKPRNIQVLKKGNDFTIEACNYKLSLAFEYLIHNCLIHAGVDARVEIILKDKNDHILVFLRDNGCGISDENKKKVFEPFFTTLDVGKGLGLGLSLANAIIKEHGGNIILDEKEEEGTLFIIDLPKKINKI